jgi:hypothetical protein
VWTDTIINGVPISTGVDIGIINTTIKSTALGWSPYAGTNSYGPSVLDTKPHMISGKMFTAELHENSYALASRVVDDKTIKYQLGQKLLEALLESNYIEYTKQVNTRDMSFIYRARIFAVPNTDVQLIRKQGINENV